LGNASVKGLETGSLHKMYISLSYFPASLYRYNSSLFHI
jgi:hypothetical protein